MELRYPAPATATAQLGLERITDISMTPLSVAFADDRRHDWAEIGGRVTLPAEADAPSRRVEGASPAAANWNRSGATSDSPRLSVTWVDQHADQLASSMRDVALLAAGAFLSALAALRPRRGWIVGLSVVLLGVIGAGASASLLGALLTTGLSVILGLPVLLWAHGRGPRERRAGSA